jgi:hypothetical protein
MKNNEPVLYSQNLSRINDVKINLSYCQKLIQNAVTEFNKIAPVTVRELEGLFNNLRVTQIDRLEELVKNKLVEGKEGNISGLQLDTERLKELIVLPDLTGIIAALDKFSLMIESETISAPDVIYWDFYSIDKNGKVKIAADAMDILTKNYKMYAETTEQKQRLTDVLKICETLKQFSITNPGINPSEICNNNLVEFADNEFLPGPQFISTGRI